MKTVKEISELTGVSIRTLRYYDEIGLLKPSHVTEAHYMEYDNKALEKLQLIMFFSELEIPLADIKNILKVPDYDRARILSTQKALLENKRNRLNGIIELIDDVMKGVSTMSFEAFNDNDINQILSYNEDNMNDDTKEKIIEKFGSYEAYQEAFVKSMKDEKTSADLIKWFGGKEKAMEGMTTPVQDMVSCQEDNKRIYGELSKLINSSSSPAEHELIEQLAECYKRMFNLDNARALLLDLANEYLTSDKLREANDKIYGEGCAEFVARAIQRYYGAI